MSELGAARLCSRGRRRIASYGDYADLVEPAVAVLLSDPLERGLRALGMRKRRHGRNRIEGNPGAGASLEAPLADGPLHRVSRVAVAGSHRMREGGGARETLDAKL